MIRLDNVSWRRGKKDSGPVLAHLSFAVPQGGFRWLLGPSGAGKSSLLSLLHLENLPTDGQMTILGKTVAQDEKRAALVRLRHRIGMVHQDYQLMPDLSVADNVALPLRLQNRPEDEIQDEVHAILKWVGLGERLDVPATRLSGGEQQRTAIARAIIHGRALFWQTNRQMHWRKVRPAACLICLPSSAPWAPRLLWRPTTNLWCAGLNGLFCSLNVGGWWMREMHRHDAAFFRP